MDASQSHDPFAPEPDAAQAQEESAQELAPPNQGEGQGPSQPDPQTREEIFPDQAENTPQSEPADAEDAPQGQGEAQDVPPGPAEGTAHSEPDPTPPGGSTAPASAPEPNPAAPSGAPGSTSTGSPAASDGPTEPGSEVR